MNIKILKEIKLLFQWTPDNWPFEASLNIQNELLEIYIR